MIDVYCFTVISYDCVDIIPFFSLYDAKEELKSYKKAWLDDGEWKDTDSDYFVDTKDSFELQNKNWHVLAFIDHLEVPVDYLYKSEDGKVFGVFVTGIIKGGFYLIQVVRKEEAYNHIHEIGTKVFLEEYKGTEWEKSLENVFHDGPGNSVIFRGGDAPFAEDGPLTYIYAEEHKIIFKGGTTP